MEIIKTINLTKYYGNSRGIIDVNLSINEGDFFGFIGPNGAGKSTTIRTLLGLITPSSGSFEIFNKQLLTNKEDILSNIGYLPSETNFYNNMKVKDIIKLSADLHKKDCTEEAKNLCERLRLDINKKINELSLGNKKKVGIICALQHKPKLYILDEPTSGLDPLMQREFYKILEERNKEGSTIFLSSHNLSEIQKYCKKAAVIKDGKIILCDNVENISHTKAKRVNLIGCSSYPMIKGIENVQISDNNICFLYSGEMNILINELSNIKFSDITITEPDLEEIFLHYYTREDK